MAKNWTQCFESKQKVKKNKIDSLSKRHCSGFNIKRANIKGREYITKTMKIQLCLKIESSKIQWCFHFRKTYPKLTGIWYTFESVTSTNNSLAYFYLYRVAGLRKTSRDNLFSNLSRQIKHVYKRLWLLETIQFLLFD